MMRVPPKTWPRVNARGVEYAVNTHGVCYRASDGKLACMVDEPPKLLELDDAGARARCSTATSGYCHCPARF